MAVAIVATITLSRQPLSIAAATIQAAARANSLRGNGTLIVGDSRTAQLRTRTFCGEPLVNVGFGGARLQTIRNRSRLAAILSHPRRVILAGGINDAIRDHSFDLAAWERALASSAADYHRSGAQVYFVTVVPPARVGPNGSHRFALERIAQMNVAMRTLGPTIDTASPMTKGGLLRQDLTWDGTHFTPAGESQWIGTMSKAVCADYTRPGLVSREAIIPPRSR